jgi:hypothetical protein
VDQDRGFVHLAREQVGQGFERAVQALTDGDAVVEHGLFQDPIRHGVFVSRVTNPDAQAPVIRAAELAVDVAQTVVAGVPPCAFELDFTGR